MIYPKGEIGKSRIIIGDNKTGLLSETDRTSRQKINKDTENMNNIINQHNQTDIYKALHSTTEFTFFQMHTEYTPRETICWAMKQHQYILKN